MKKTNFKGKYTIYTNNNEQFDYNKFVEDCKENNMEDDEIPSENSAEFYNWCNEENEFNMEADMMNIEGCKAYTNIPLIVEGSIGRWNGRREIEPIECADVAEAIKMCISANCPTLTDVIWEDGVINIIVRHHDGENYFTIRHKDKRRKLPYLYDVA